jgi:hypothetical protein
MCLPYHVTLIYVLPLYLVFRLVRSFQHVSEAQRRIALTAFCLTL